MKFLFDPKWLPALKEVEVPVVVVGAGREQILDDIRSMVRAMRNQPMVMLDMTTLSNHVYPLGPDNLFHFSHSEPFHPAALGPGMSDPSLPMDEARKKWFDDVCKFNMRSLVEDRDLSEYAAPESKSVINKALRKKRDAQKASQNAKGRKWWEHR